METGDFSKRQQLDQKENDSRTHIDPQHIDKISHSETGFSSSLNNNVYQFSEKDATLKSETYK